MKQLLVVVGVVALWLATFNVPDGTGEAGIIIRLGILLMVVISAGFSAIYFRGKRQAFWAGFFVAMLALYFHGPNFSVVARSWTAPLLLTLHKSTNPVNMLTTSIWAVLQLSFSAVAGLIASLIYDQSPSRK
ncbi:MAG TPA: hypothetical protein VGJ04_07160 [Pirellulales bacterium]